MTLSLEKTKGDALIVQRHHATWQDYVELRDGTDRNKIAPGLSIALVESNIERLDTETNTAAAGWFMQQLQTQTS